MKAIRLVLLNLVVLLGLLVLVEGAAGFFLVAYRLLSYERRDPARVHSEYHSELGWINRRSVHLPNQFGRGAHVTTNAQRFRSLQDVSPTVPPGKTRIVCSGDSFTFGIGVGDEYPWCQQLSGLDAGLDPVNLAHGGWGIDQAYLWYLKNQALEHDVHLFAFIADDFRRVGLKSFRGSGKPYLTINNGTLVQQNNPVSRSGYYLPRLMAAGESFANLHLVTLAAKIARRLHPDTEHERAYIKAVSSRIFAELARLSHAHKRRLVLVYLPIYEDYLKDPRGETEAWRAFVHAEAEQHGYELIDVAEAFRRLPADIIPELFRLNSDGHYTVGGHQQVAEIVYRALMPH